METHTEPTPYFKIRMPLTYWYLYPGITEMEKRAHSMLALGLSAAGEATSTIKYSYLFDEIMSLLIATDANSLDELDKTDVKALFNEIDDLCVSMVDELVDCDATLELIVETMFSSLLESADGGKT